MVKLLRFKGTLTLAWLMVRVSTGVVLLAGMGLANVKSMATVLID